MPTAEGRPLTPRQRAQLQQLLDAGALDRESGKTMWDEGMTDCSPLVIGALRDRSWADSRSVRPAGGSQATAYWLTPAGLEAARELAKSPPPPRRSVP